MQITFNMFNFVQLCCHCVKSHLANFDRTLFRGDSAGWLVLTFRNKKSGLYLSWVGSWCPRPLRIEGRRCGNPCTGRQTGAACGSATYLIGKKGFIAKNCDSANGAVDVCFCTFSSGLAKRLIVNDSGLVCPSEEL